MTINKQAQSNFLLIDETLQKYARKSSDYHRIQDEECDIRTPFARDVDRIIHSHSYTRYMDKTQVYSFKNNDHISKRMVHVQLVSKIARTIGRALRLNTDLIEAISLGHDIGHTPLGHFGESVLNKISLKETNTYFAHNIQSVREYMSIENDGKGLNLCIETLDGIMCHNGEMLEPLYKPTQKDTKEVLKEFESSYYDLDNFKKYTPMTLEGCVVRISDLIAYLGRDIEDAIELGLFKKEELPANIKKVLGDNNKDITNNIILDIINESLDQNYIKMSEEVFNCIQELKSFNNKTLYYNAMTDDEKTYYEEKINELYEYYLTCLKEKKTTSTIYTIFLKDKCQNYLNNTSNERVVLDYIAGMTDTFLINEIKKTSEKLNENN